MKLSARPPQARHRRGGAARRTGLPAHTIRAWEKRYGAVRPARTEGGHRLYSEEQVLRLRVLAELTGRGHRIGSIAAAPTEELEDLLAATRQDVGAAAEPLVEGGTPAEVGGSRS